MHAFRIGRIFGIDIRLDWSWVFIFVLLTWNLSAVFSAWHPAWRRLAPHSLRFGLRVRSITLFLFGGVSNIEREPPSPQAEFLTAIAGPCHELSPWARTPRRRRHDHRNLAP
jgi:Zn-dependent protease